MPDSAELLRSALAAARRGWRVFPVVPGAKRPAVKEWEHRATDDPDRITRCWANGPYNVGIATGPSGLVVVDLDTPKAAVARFARGAATSATAATSQVGPVADRRPVAAVPATSATAARAAHGRDVFAALCAGHGQPIPSATFIVATPSGGWHLYYRQPQHGPALRNTKGGTSRALGDAIDTRGHGGYVVAAGSVIADRRYTVVRDVDPAPLPGWLAALLRGLDQAASAPTPVRPVRVSPAVTDRGAAYLSAAVAREAEHVRAAREGSRNAVLWGAAVALGQLVAGGELDRDTVTEVLEQGATVAGLATNDIRPTIRSGLRRGAQRPRTVTR